MAMKKTHDAVYAGEKYTDHDGNEKTRYLNMGALFQRDDGSLTVKIESIPVGFNGWVNFYEPRTKDGEQTQRPGSQSQAAQAAGDFQDDDIPF